MAGLSNRDFLNRIASLGGHFRVPAAKRGRHDAIERAGDDCLRQADGKQFGGRGVGKDILTASAFKSDQLVDRPRFAARAWTMIAIRVQVGDTRKAYRRLDAKR